MLGSHTVYAILGVKDLEEAREFYEQKLGLTKIDENPGGITYKSGETKVFVYPSEYAGTNQSNAAWWEVDDIESVVEDLKGRGITFEHYDMEGVTREGDIHIMGPMKAAWFKDPTGNILYLGSAT